MSVHTCGGGEGYPIPGRGGRVTPSQVWDGGGGTPSQVWVGGGGYPISGLGGVPHPRSRGVPHLRSGWGGTLSQVRGVPHLRSGYPIPGLGGGVPGVPPIQVWMVGGTPSQVWVGVPEPPHETEQHSEHLVRGGGCASCVHAGGLSCLRCMCLMRSLLLHDKKVGQIPSHAKVCFPRML